MISISLWARGDNSTANNASINSLNTSQVPVTELTFVAVPGASAPNDPYGDILLDPNNGSVDPDTQVIINGVQMDFTVEFSGNLPMSKKFTDLAVGDKEVVVISAIEHHAILDPAHWLETHEGAEVILVPVNVHGVIELEFLKDLIAQRGHEIAVISIMHSNNETGVIQPIREVVTMAGDIPVHTDAVQSFKKVPLSYKELGVTALTISAHKVGGPLGIGALILRRAYEIPALLHGGGQEREIRSGTLNAPAIVAFAAAAASKIYEASKVQELRERFEAGLLKSAPSAYINGVDAKRLPGISNVTFPGTQSDSLLLLMDSEKVSCSTGAACSAGVHRPSHVLLAMGHNEISAQSSLRFSLGANSTQADVDFALSVLPTVIERGRAANQI